MSKAGQSHQLMRACESVRIFMPARLSDWGPCQLRNQGKKGENLKQNIQTQT